MGTQTTQVFKLWRMTILKILNAYVMYIHQRKEHNAVLQFSTGTFLVLEQVTSAAVCCNSTGASQESS
jgi:hypothetical protein